MFQPRIKQETDIQLESQANNDNVKTSPLDEDISMASPSKRASPQQIVHNDFMNNKNSLLYSLSFVATKLRIEKLLSASKTLNVPTAEFFLPVNG